MSQDLPPWRMPVELPESGSAQTRVEEDDDHPFDGGQAGGFSAIKAEDPADQAGFNTVWARWGSSRLLLYAAGVLLLAAFLLDLIDLVVQAAAFSTPLGLLIGAVTLFAACLVVKLSIEEFLAFRRLDHIDAMRERGARLSRSQDAQGGGADFVAEIKGLYQERNDLRDTLNKLDQSVSDYHNDIEIISLVQKGVLAPLDGRAYRLVMQRARDTMVITTLSPSPMLDALLVLWQNLKLVRGIAAVYGARPGYLGGIRLLKRMVASLAVAGLSDSAQHLAAAALGGGLAAAVSTRIGQGLVNGLLTARIGLVAMAQCRPLPFPDGEEPMMGRIRTELLTVPKRLV